MLASPFVVVVACVYVWRCFVFLSEKRLTAPIIPKIKGPEDISNFDDYPDDDGVPPYVDNGGASLVALGSLAGSVVGVWWSHCLLALLCCVWWGWTVARVGLC